MVLIRQRYVVKATDRPRQKYTPQERKSIPIEEILNLELGDGHLKAAGEGRVQNRNSLTGLAPRIVHTTSQNYPTHIGNL